MELWGGIECTLNRVGGLRFDQLARSGHYTRGDDIERIAGLGIATLRYPLLWERAATASPGEYDWTFADERLAQLRANRITPVVGLVHHGCGPDYTELMAESFATGLADYARQLAERHPWLEWYTPVNELLTTARFSGLYGVWHPHARDDQSFARMLVNECRATVLAMRAIRRVNSAAKLLQTDDLGTIYSTPKLAYQAEFENHRRWLGWDLLCGFVDAHHPLCAWLRRAGVRTRELGWFVDNACPPDLIGIDHYVTSDRYLDEQRGEYPRSCWGRNGRDEYADVEAVRVLARPGTSLADIMREAAYRYRVPLVLSEVHIGCSVDEQRAWLADAWTTACVSRSEGIDVRAVTTWALLGCFDWDSLATAGGNTYESGAFRIVGGALQRTELAGLVESLARGGDASSLPRRKGWWHRNDRWIFGKPRSCAVDVSFLPFRRAASYTGY